MAHTGAEYLLQHNAHSQASAHFYLTNKGNKEFNNGATLNLVSIIKHVMSLSSEAEYVLPTEQELIPEY